MADRGVVHTFPDKTGDDHFGWYSWLPSVVWNKKLGLFIMVNGGTYAGQSLSLSDFYSPWMHSKTGSLGFYYAEKPWGPWTEFSYDPYWTVDGTGNRTYQPKLSPKWISEDGTEMVLIWSDAMSNAAGKSHTVNYRWNQMKIKILGPYDEPPARASSPSPANNAVDISRFEGSRGMNWISGARTHRHNVYFGTDPTPDSGELQGSRFPTRFVPGLLETHTTYYWRIDEMNNIGTTAGPVWSFTTGSETELADLAGHWPLDEGNGSIAADATGRGNDGVLEGGASWAVTKAGGAMNFDGRDDTVTVNNVTADLKPSSLTIAAWVKTGKGDAHGWVAAQGDNYGLVVNRQGDSNDVFFYYFNGSAWPSVSSGDVNITDDRWHHVAATYTAGGHMKMYKDGVEVGRSTTSGSISYTHGDGFTIGTMQGSRNFEGKILDVRVYSRDLSGVEIMMLHTQGRRRWE